ncbi:hypothetical protein F4677DRAFT_465037 [Hypoxylon crocopeplum]|nr:hypothetical protein F4677DRAFT_465037 [Hypoxylon crocopeplum]
MDKLRTKRTGIEWGTCDHAGIIARLEIESFPSFYDNDEFEERCQKHYDRLCKGLTHYRLVFHPEENGVKSYIGFMSFQWNLHRETTLMWPKSNENVVLPVSRIPTQPLLERLRKSSPWILEQDFLFVHRICVRDVYRRQGLGSMLINHLEQVAGMTGLKILSFADGRPDANFIDFHERELALSEAQAKDAAGMLRRAPRDKILQQEAFYSRGNVRIDRQLADLVQAAAAKPEFYPLDFYRKLGFVEADMAFRWSPTKPKMYNDGLQTPRMICPLEYGFRSRASSAVD